MPYITAEQHVAYGFTKGHFRPKLEDFTSNLSMINIFASIVCSCRCTNQLAHVLAARSFNSSSDFVFMHETFWDLRYFISQDLRFT